MAGGKSVVIWVDSDGFVAANQYHSVLLTSVVKGVGESVTQVIKDVAKGKYSNTPYVGTLANKGTLLAPYHDFSSKVSAKLQLAVKIVGNNIRSGAIKVS